MAVRLPDVAAARPAWILCATNGCRNGGTSGETLRSPHRHGSTAPVHASGHDDQAALPACADSSFLGCPSVVAHLLIRLKMVASRKSWSFAAAMPACVRARRSSCRARSVPAAAFQPRDSGARFLAPVAPVLTDLPREAGDAMPSNIYTARFFKQYPGPSLRFSKISATRLLQDLNCYAQILWFSSNEMQPPPNRIEVPCRLP